MARAVGISPSSVRRIWAGQGLQPHRVRAFKLSNDPKFADKLKEVVGLYIDPPAHAVVLSIDEKWRIPGAQPHPAGSAEMKKGRCATMTHDYKRHGTTTLFAALHGHPRRQGHRPLHATPPASGIHPLSQRRRARGRGQHGGPCGAQQLRHPQAPQGEGLAAAACALHLSLHPDLVSPGPMPSKAGLPSSPGNASNAASSPRSSSCRPRSTVSSPTPKPKPRPFVWTKSADAILAAVNRGRQALEAMPSA